MVRLVRLLPADRGRRLSAGLARAFGSRASWVVAVFGALLYAVLYLLVSRGIVIDPQAQFSRFGTAPSLTLARDLSWRSLIDPFNPPALLLLGDALAVVPSLPQLGVAVVVGALFGANLAVAFATLRQRTLQCARASALGALATLPSFLLSFSCCAPTVLLVLGANAAVAVVALVPYVVPAAIVLMLASLLWSAARLERIASGELAPL